MKYAVVFVITALIYQQVEAMSLFDIGKVCVFSAVKAKLTRNGEPLKHVQVIRRWEWNELKEDATTTDESGNFEFSAIYEKSLTRLLPVELVVAQGLYVVDNAEERKVWSNSKREPEENAEFNGQPIEITCELTHEMAIHKEFGSRMRTLCTWGD